MEVDWDMPGCGRAQGLTPADSQSYPRQPHQADDYETRLKLSHSLAVPRNNPHR